MLISAAFPSNWLKASDLQGKETKYTISHCQMETIGDGEKPVLYFEELEKGLVMNKTNSQFLEMLYGDETNNWAGAEIILYPTETDYQGKRVAAIRLKVPPRKPVRPAAPAVRQRVIPSGPSYDPNAGKGVGGIKGNGNPATPDDPLEDAPF